MLKCSLSLVAMALLCSPVVGADGDHGKQSAAKHDKHEELHWGYAGATGPDHWADLSPEFHWAKDGHEQSPVDFDHVKSHGRDRIEFHFRASQLHLVNNGHTIQENVDNGNYFILDGMRYDLKQFHFHSPSEHTVDHKNLPMEMHLVSQNAKGELTVLGVFLESGESNPNLDHVFQHLPPDIQHPIELTEQIDVSQLIPKNHQHYRYEGSLTTPPCTEHVHWLVFTEPIKISEFQLKRFRALIDHNNRPVQPLYSRTVSVNP